ncbi:hypothetical protein [Anoxybacillus sp. EFIL]|uniref:hypothetical protein n=1 Tax=Anoxybacillus sp. EFIL TaxID=2508869 RepID=UPI00148CB5B5|nr:hypothetical protein [Anoxybacillus sp. EFIL]NNU96165.1 hypothetical protein [Anoxybacillus sp. EFIL]
MAVTAKKLARVTINSTSTTTLYTVPANTKTIVKSIAIAGATNADTDFYLMIGGVALFNGATVKMKDTIIVDGSFVLEAGETITANLASGTNIISIHISGVEVA